MIASGIQTAGSIPLTAEMRCDVGNEAAVAAAYAGGRAMGWRQDGLHFEGLQSARLFT